MRFYSAAFEVLTEDLKITRSVQSTAVYNVNWSYVDNTET